MPPPACRALAPSNQTTQTFFDADGEATRRIDPDGHTTQTIYDPDGQATATVDGLGQTSYTYYDADGNLTAVIDQDGNETSDLYNADQEQKEESGAISPLTARRRRDIFGEQKIIARPFVCTFCRIP